MREAAAKILETVPHIDALICNAAIAQVAKQEITVDGFESQLGVNHFGHFLLCGLLFERIEQSAGRIVVVGSNAYKMGLKRIQFEDLNFDRELHRLEFLRPKQTGADDVRLRIAARFLHSSSNAASKSASYPQIFSWLLGSSATLKSSLCTSQFSIRSYAIAF